VDYFFSRGLRENVSDVLRRLTNCGVQVAVADRYDQRQVARPQEP